MLRPASVGRYRSGRPPRDGRRVVERWRPYPFIRPPGGSNGADCCSELGCAEEGRFIEVTPFTRIVLTWGWSPGPFDIPAGSTTVEYTLTPVDGGTRLHLLHHGLPQTPEIAAAHGVGWDHYLARLALVAAGGEAPDDPWTRGAMQD